MMRWWRRNAVAFVVAPLAVWGTWIVVGEPLRSWRDADDVDRRVVEVGGEMAWSPTATIRLVDLTAPDPILVDDRDDPFLPPAGTTVWRARFDAAATTADGQGLCRVSLLDGEGRRFSPSLVELSVLGGDGTCLAGPDDDPAGYELMFWFLLPSGVEPVELTVGSFDSSTVFAVPVG